MELLKITKKRSVLVSLFLLGISTLFILIISTTTSPIYCLEGGDSTIYKLLGLGITQGRIPYVDLFDNKGIYLYLINALGFCINDYRWGIFTLQIINLFVALVFLYRTIRIFCQSAKSILVISLSLFLLTGCYQGGNHVEEWMLPFLSIGFFTTINLFTKDTLTFSELYKNSILWGIGCGFVLMLRPNDAVAFYGGIMTGVTLWLFQKKNYRYAVVNIIIFITSTLLTIAPVIIWYACHEELHTLFYAVFGVNSLIAGGVEGQLFTLFKWGKWAILLLIVTLCVMITSTQYKKMLWGVVPISIIQVILLGDKMYAHYFIPLFPLLTLYVTMIFIQQHKPVIILAVAILCLSHRPLPRMAALNLYSSYRLLCNNTCTSQTLYHCPIPEEEQSKVWNYSVDPWRPGTPLSWFIRNNIVQCNRRTGSLDEYVKEIDFKTTSPLWVVSYGHEFEKNSNSTYYYITDSISTQYYTLLFYKKDANLYW